MKKKLPYIISVIVLTIIGAVVNFYATNMVLSDISNAYDGLRDIYFISSIPALMFACLFVLAILYIARLALRPEYKKSLSKLYLIIAICLSVIGLVSSILSGTIVYHSFTKPYPFPGYSVLALIIFIVLLIGFSYLLYYVIKKVPNDTEKRKKSVKYGIYTFLLVIFMYFTLNRFGVVIWGPSYIQGRTFYLTWPYYLWLLLPLCLFIIIACDLFNYRKEDKLHALIHMSIFTAVGIGLTIYTIYLGMTNTQYVSAISPTVGAERLLAKPVDTILQTAIFLAFALFFLIRTIILYVKSKKNAN